MKFSYHWIKELVPGLHVEPKELMRLITMKTAECEGLEFIGAALASASVARVTAVELIKGSHNQIAVVETTRYGKKQVVCGAPNCRPARKQSASPGGNSGRHTPPAFSHNALSRRRRSDCL